MTHALIATDPEYAHQHGMLEIAFARYVAIALREGLV